MAYFQRLFPQRVVSATMVWDLRQIDKLLRTHEKMCAKLDKAKRHLERTGERPMVRYVSVACVYVCLYDYHIAVAY